MGTVTIVLSFAILVALVVGIKSDGRARRSFTVDYEADTFVMDGKPFRYVSGSFHYFRALPETWRIKLRTMRAAGLNVVDIYVEWALHNPKKGVYNFDGIANLEQFIKFAKLEGLYVILRPGPYICAERDNGGLPYWLFTEYPNLKPRTSDPNYKKEIQIWYSHLMPKLQQYLYANNGPIIMVQVENEYGVFEACDKDYLNWLRDETKIYIQDKALLFTTDIPNDRISCGKIDGVFATTDFGIDRAHEMDEIWKTLRTVQPKGPLVNSEFYPGWLVHWQEENQRRDPDLVADTLKKMLERGANVNIYMFFGGTNFGFTAGANDFGHSKYQSDITSYDYDAPMDEAGDPTEKYLKIKKVIDQFSTLPIISIPEKSRKMDLPAIELKPISLLLSENGLKYLSVKTIQKSRPVSFEELNQFSGFVLYETKLPIIKIDPTLLTVNDLRDRAIVLIDNIFVGILSRENSIYSLPISSSFGRNLQILVENQGRINFNIANDTKGIFGNVTIQQRNGELEILNDWTSISIPLEIEQIENLVKNSKSNYIQLFISFIKDLINEKINTTPKKSNELLLLEGPVVFYGEFTISKDTIYDTYLDPSDWGKGVVFINGFNLGRYWPLVGPQITMYLPKELLKKGKNEIVIIEYQRAAENGRIRFTHIPKLDGISINPKEIDGN